MLAHGFCAQDKIDRLTIDTQLIDTLSTNLLTVSWESTNFRWMHMKRSTLDRPSTDCWSSIRLSVDWASIGMLIKHQSRCSSMVVIDTTPRMPTVQVHVTHDPKNSTKNVQRKHRIICESLQGFFREEGSHIFLVLEHFESLDLPNGEYTVVSNFSFQHCIISCKCGIDCECTGGSP